MYVHTHKHTNHTHKNALTHAHIHTQTHTHTHTHTQISKVFCTNSASTKWPFSGVFSGPYSPKYNPILMKFSPQVVLKQVVFCSSWYTLGQGQRVNRNFYIAYRIQIFPKFEHSKFHCLATSRFRLNPEQTHHIFCFVNQLHPF